MAGVAGDEAKTLGVPILGVIRQVSAFASSGVGTRSWTGPAPFRNAGGVRISDLGVCDHFIFKAFPSKVDTIARK